MASTTESRTVPLDLKALRDAVGGSEGRPPTAAAFRCITEYQPAGGAGDKVFPPTYLGGVYAFEDRRIDGRVVRCVLLDSVQSQANRLELALLDAWRAKSIGLPVIVVDFADNGLLAEVGRNWKITSLDAPHRIADAILRDSVIAGTSTRFCDSDHATKWGNSRVHNATELFALCPTALLFGTWGSPKKPGGLGAKFSRCIVSELIAIDAVSGCKTESRLDPLGIVSAAKVVINNDGTWRMATSEKEKGAVSPSEINHSNIPPSFTKYKKGAEGADSRRVPEVELEYRVRGREGEADSLTRMRGSEPQAREGSIAAGGVTMTKAIQTTVISLPAIRRLQFPIGGESNTNADHAARVVLTALGLCASVLARELGGDLRSRCQLVPTSKIEWELIGKPGDTPTKYELSGTQSIALLNDAVAAANAAGLPTTLFKKGEAALSLTPSPELVALVKKSQDLAAATGGGDEGGEG